MELTGRLHRELVTFKCMLKIFCNKHHNSPKQALCEDCIAVQKYAEKRLQHCPFDVEKPTCANCQVHCYNKEMRGKVQTIMRYAGPRMLFSHPLLAILHILDGKKQSKTGGITR